MPYAYFTFAKQIFHIGDIHSFRKERISLKKASAKADAFFCPIGTKKIFFRFYCMTLNSHILLIKRLYYFCTADKYDLDLFFGLDNHAFQYLSDELVIVCHRMIF